MINEIWKDINGYENKYQISSTGKCRSCDRFVECKNRWGKTINVFHKGQVIKQSKNNKGYSIVHLSKDNKSTTFLTHRLVAELFIDNPDNLPEVNHKDENKCNNHVDNLEWCTRAFNNNYGKLNKNGRRKSRQHLMKKVAQFTLDGKLIGIYDGLLIAKEKTGCNNTCIARCCEGLLKTSGGYVWKYFNQ